MGHLTDSRHSPNKMAVCSVSSGTVGPGWISELYQSQITDCAALQKAVMAQLSTSPAFLGTAALFRCVCISLVRPVTHSLTPSVRMSHFASVCLYTTLPRHHSATPPLTASLLLYLYLPICYSASVLLCLYYSTSLLLYLSTSLPLCYSTSLLLCLSTTL